MKQSKENCITLKNTVLCAASGAATAVLFDIPEAGFLCWVTLAPAFFILLKNRGNVRRLLKYCAVVAVCFLAVYYAAIFTLDLSVRMGASGTGVLIAGYLTVTAVHAGILFLALFAGVVLRCPGWLRGLWIAVLWAAAEWLMGAGALGLPCMRLAATQTAYPMMMGALPVGGTLLLSLLMVWVNVLTAQAIAAFRKREMRRGFLLCAAAAAVCAGNVLTGAAYAPQSSHVPVSVAALQYNMPSYEGEPGKRYEKAIVLAWEAANRQTPALILLPENTVFGSLAEDETLAYPLKELARQGGAYVFTGVYGRYGYQMKGSVFMAQPDGSFALPYHKQRFIPFFENGYEQAFRFETGTERGLFDTEYGTVGTVICFESMFSDVVADTVRGGAQAICIFTNDSWFRGDAAQKRHFAHAVLRAKETGRYVVQVSNNGVTGIVAPDGRITGQLDVGREGCLYGEIEFLTAKTPYLCIGDWWIAWGGAAVLAVALWKGRKYDRA